MAAAAQPDAADATACRAAPGHAKVFWLGRHAGRPELGAPVSKVHAQGLELLRSLGWRQVPHDAPGVVPVFALATRKSANYPACGPGLPLVRQLPHSHVSSVDDKRALARHLAAAGRADLLPRSWDSLAEFVAWLDAPVAPAAADAGVAPPDSGLLPFSVFAKHRAGVKGQAVYTAHSREELAQLVRRLGASGRDFVVQAEVAPPLLLAGCKCVLRLHVLAVAPRCCGSGSCGAGSGEAGTCGSGSGSGEAGACCASSSGSGEAGSSSAAAAAAAAAAHAAYLHRDVIVLQHAAPYEPRSRDPAAHISSRGPLAGGGRPAPALLAQLPELHAAVWPRLVGLVAGTIAAAAPALFPAAGAGHAAAGRCQLLQPGGGGGRTGPAAEVDVPPPPVLYALLGLDVALDASGAPLLLEANAFPAIASGTMAAVPAGVYMRLLRDLLTLLVLPAADGVAAAPGGFERV